MFSFSHDFVFTSADIYTFCGDQLANLTISIANLTISIVNLTISIAFFPANIIL